MIVDANIVVKWFVAEDDSDAALALRLQGDLFAPDVMLIEYRNALLNKVRRQAISLNEARRGTGNWQRGSHDPSLRTAA